MKNIEDLTNEELMAKYNDSWGVFWEENEWEETVFAELQGDTTKLFEELLNRLNKQND